MTEYWVSQGNKWCDFCKIFISNNPSSIRNHELGQRHKENVAKRLATMRKESAAKEKEQKDAVRALEQIESKAKRSYQKDVASYEARDSNPQALDGQEDWEYDSSSGYYYNQNNGLYFDPKSGFYYSDAVGKWVTQEEAYAKVQASSDTKSNGPILKKPFPTSGAGPVADSKSVAKSKNETAPGPVLSSPLNPMRSVKGAQSSLAVKRKRQDEKKPKAVSKEEAAALKAREAAKKRVEDREKPLLGLYKGPR
ncbi:Zinc-finger and OCRE domain-containing Protein 1 [Hibiscus trionum]|uniref:Zinc-finger and OCRE domain-containing Protein 1 n=1 Tax=Hibiscus trionum TaxID=183268 RepID=A0A9W7JDR7_HIBTR|nr:Zinc-finger and OCRE domain-containing Protein 1 [Hibiscus trionum]